MKFVRAIRIDHYYAEALPLFLASKLLLSSSSPPPLLSSPSVVYQFVNRPVLRLLLRCTVVVAVCAFLPLPVAPLLCTPPSSQTTATNTQLPTSAYIWSLVRDLPSNSPNPTGLHISPSPLKLWLELNGCQLNPSPKSPSTD